MARSSNVEAFLIDFRDEEEGGGGGIRFKEGTYLVRIASAKTGISENKGTPYLELILIHKGGKYNKKKFTERLYASPKAYKRFRLLMEALDLTPPKGKLNLVNLAKDLKGEELYVQIEDDDSRDTVRSVVAFEGFINKDDYDPEADADDEEEEDEDLEEEEEDEEEEDEEEDEEEEPEPPKRRRAAAKAKPKSARRSRKAKDEEEDEDEDEDEEEDEEEEEPPARKRRAAAKKPAARKKASSKRKAKDEDEEDEEEDDLNDLDLDEM